MRSDGPAAAGSVLHDRLIFVVTADARAGEELTDRIARQPGTVRCPAPTHLFDQGLSTIDLTYVMTGDDGMRAMAEEPRFLTALRRLGDAALVPFIGTAERLVEYTPEHASHEPLIRRVFPDARVVTDRDFSVLDHPGRGPTPKIRTATNAASPFSDRAVFIFGSPRSGTTWLEQLLLAHPDIAGIHEGETRIFRALAPLWANRERQDGTGIGQRVDRATLAAHMRVFCDDLFAAARDRFKPGASVFVEKTPMHARHLPQMSAIYPDGWYLHIVRDGRDVARSIAQLEFGHPDLLQGARAWRSLQEAVARQAPNLARYRMVRYEDVLVDPVAAAGELFEWIGLPIDDETRGRVGDAAGVRVSQYTTTGRVGAGKWREELDDAELSRIYLSAGDALVQYGYLDAAELAAWRTRPVFRRVRAIERWRERASALRRRAR